MPRDRRLRELRRRLAWTDSGPRAGVLVAFAPRARPSRHDSGEGEWLGDPDGERDAPVKQPGKPLCHCSGRELKKTLRDESQHLVYS